MLKQLDSIPLGRMYQASFKAVVRLHLYFTGRTHELFGEFSDKARVEILKAATPPRLGEGDRVLDGSAGLKVQSKLTELWNETFSQWQVEFERVRVEAGSIPFGVWAMAHERLALPVISDRRSAISEAVIDGVFLPQLRILMNAASEHLYGDTLNLSGRIWRIDREAEDGINAILLKGIANGDSAWNIAKELEQFLGANADCPRWTSTRLYGRTKTQIAQGDTTGLISSPCDGRGVSYNALRLARTEIQKIHALATDKVLASQPWVEKERIHLSAAHPSTDVCDDVVRGGVKGDGIYEVGTIELPLHPNCLCYKTAVLMSDKEFTRRLNGWLNGTQDWSAMDDYATTFTAGGGQLTDSVLPEAINLAVWVFSEELEEWMK